MDEDKKDIVYKIAKVMDEFRIVLNKGLVNGIKSGQRFLVYEIGEEVLDPDTKQSLGRIEIVKGTGKVTHVQDNISTIESDMSTRPAKSVRRIKRPGALEIFSGSEEIEELMPSQKYPFDHPKVGDIAKPI